MLVQVFQKKKAVLGGMDEALAILHECAGHYDPDGEWVPGWDALTVKALEDGDAIEPWETVISIEGDYALFCHLETAYLGSLARRTLVATNVHEVVEAARGKPIMYFPARHDHYRVQTGDGYAAHVAGAIGVSTDAQASWWGGKGYGTVPHGLIAAYGGDTVKASERFAAIVGDETNIVVLVDFDNDSVTTALAVARALGDRLWGVRLDTSNTMVDRSLWPQMGRFDPRGVNPQLVWNVRHALDRAGFGARAHRRLRRLRRGEDRRVRGRRGAGGRVRRRLHPDPRRERLHRRRRDERRPPGRQARPRAAAEPAPRAGGRSARIRARRRRRTATVERVARAAPAHRADHLRRSTCGARSC